MLVETNCRKKPGERFPAVTVGSPAVTVGSPAVTVGSPAVTEGSPAARAQSRRPCGCNLPIAVLKLGSFRSSQVFPINCAL